MSKFIYNIVAFASGSGPSASGQDYFYDDDASTFENPYLNGDAAAGFYIGSAGPNGGEVAQATQGVRRDQMAGFVARVLEWAVENGGLPNHFAPTTVHESPASTPVGSSILVSISGANVTNVAVSGPCTSGVSQANTPAQNNTVQTLNLSVPLSSSAATGQCALTATVTYSDNSTQTFPLQVVVTAAQAPAGNYSRLAVVYVDPADSTFEARDGNGTYTFTYGQPGTTYSYGETPGANGSSATHPVSMSQFATFLSGAAAPTAGDVLTVTYAGAGGVNTFAFARDVPAAATGVTAGYVNAVGPGSGAHPAGVLVTWTAPTNADVFAYQVQYATLDSSGQPSAFVDAGSGYTDSGGTFTQNVSAGHVTGTQSAAGVVQQAPVTDFLDTNRSSGSQVVYRVIAYADGNDGGSCTACTSTFADAGSMAPPSAVSAPATVSSSAAGTSARADASPTDPTLASITRPASAPVGATLYVSPQGSDGNTCGASASPCQTIGQAITNASSGDTVHVGPGTYHELVVVSKPLILQGFGATISAAGLDQGSGQTEDAAAVMVPQPGSGSRVEGLTVHGAYGEGILVVGASNVVVTGNTVSGNDLGNPSNTSYLECQAQGEVPGDCGEGMHLMTTTGSTMVDNVSVSNSGGILVTDELGPSTGNAVTGNLVSDNLYDCGITIPSHNPNALDSSGTPQPTKGGIYGNTVSKNLVFGNGVRGFGAGVLIAAAGPGMAVYDNTISDNVINGNGLAGVTVHAHTPNQDVSNNTIQNNVIGQNNVTGDGDANDMVTTGIIIYSAAAATTEIVSGNTIYDNEQRIFLSNATTN